MQISSANGLQDMLAWFHAKNQVGIDAPVGSKE
ncbi:uncharacterized protein VDAG_10197 [Verticillium dahliae VdLs.17]|uniref:Uncharacterized protein n=1 Tax=Verticillium dahliae (strain VdLs.17 / ATCC MYA-4575 / FGSC 10137) TaxID=498257 RepID=G2XJ65_VERDV|nr:uncharacterized protein VDAG_10197 [Verticillium dahliae VdLs.17]EGY20568.1 hypothetical protein VDAG_10197 [Verticillium dahliae VdLs.17]